MVLRGRCIRRLSAHPRVARLMQALKAYRSTSVGMAAVAWRPGAGHVVTTASHDGAVRMWDLRSPLPLATLAEHPDKLLAVAWRDANTLVCGGCDAQVYTYSVPDPGAATAEP